MDEAVRKALEEMLEDIRSCRYGSVPTGATLGKLERQIKELLQKEKTKELSKDDRRQP